MALSFFSGAGGLDIGIGMAGFDIKLSVEIEKTYCKTLKMNHPKLNIVNEDIMKYNKEKVYKDANLKINTPIDLIIGGSPCQSFSTAGKRQAFEDIRGKAMIKYAMGGAYNSGGGKVGFYRRVKINEPSPTLLTSPIQKSTNLGHPFEDRPLSIQEYLAIQGFLLDYQVAGTINDKYT